MAALGPSLVYALCLAASLWCAFLLLHAWRQTRSRLLFWSALGFVFLSVNNLFLVGDLVLFPQVDLWPLRQAASGLAVAVLLYGFIWEAER
ncbi:MULTISPECIES: DUF5985 family protein [unclassified Phenylobacterium]|uniref:DUF5985 family protein n=1 Tax=unclassified Phenylobacterium TaxID=2640670 RepID=UPI00083AC0F7|nr:MULTISPECIES: DUF5985 family protein [unclassified Phenylobacterium]